MTTITTPARAPDPVSRRSIIAAMAAVPAAAAAGPPAGATASDVGAPTLAHADAALIALGRQLDELEPLLRAAQAREGDCWKRFREAEPAQPAALLVQSSDHDMNLRLSGCHDEFFDAAEVRKIRAKPRVHSVAYAYDPATGQTWPEDQRPEGVRETLLKNEPWPKAQARADEIAAAWDAWTADVERVERDTGATAASEALDVVYDRRRAICDAITAAPASTVVGLFVKAQAVACFDDLESADDEGPQTRALLSIARDLIRMRG